MDVKSRFSLKPLFCLVYLLTLLVLVALLNHERGREARPFTLAGASVTAGREGGVLSLEGGRFSSDLKGVLASNLVNEKAQLWQRLDGVSTKSVDVAQRLALACFEQTLVSLSLAEPESPQFLGSIKLPADLIGVRIINDMALVAMERHAGLALIDLHDPSNLRLVAQYPLSGMVTSMAIDRSTVYFVDMYRGLGRIDLSAKQPVLEQLVSLDSPWRLAMQGSRLAVGTLKGNVHLFNLSGDGPLAEAGILRFPQNVRGLVLTGETLAVALADGTLHSFSLAAWPNLGEGAALRLPGRPLQLGRIPDREGVVASLVAGGMALVDLSQTKAPRLFGHLKISKTLYDMTIQPGRVFGATHAGVVAYDLDEIANGEDASLASDAVIDRTHHQLITWNGHVYGYNKTSRSLVDFGASGAEGPGSTDRLLVIAATDGLDYFEVSGEGQVSLGGALVLEGPTVDARLRDEHLYVVNRQGLRIFNATQAKAPVKVSELPLSDITGYFALMESGYLLAAAIDGGLLVVDVRDPHRPVQVARLSFPQNALKAINHQNLLVNGQRVFVSQTDNGVYVVDVSTPESPELLQIIETPGIAKDMTLYDGLLLVADGNEGVFVIDVSDLNMVLPVGSWPVPLRVSRVAVTTDSVIVSNYPGGTMRLPLPQRLRNLKIINRSEGRAEVQKVTKGPYVYLYDGQATAKAKVAVQ